MEAGLVILLISATFWFLLEEKYASAAVLAACMLVTRVDTIAWIGLCLVVVVARTRRLPAREFAIGLLCIAPWLVVATLYYGTFVPHSLIAKGVIPIRATTHWTVLLDNIVPSLARTLETAAYPIAVRPVLWPLGFGLWVLALLHIRRTGRTILLLFPAYVGAYNGFLWVGDAPDMGWYNVPALWCSAIFLALGLEESRHRLAGWLRGRRVPEWVERGYGAGLLACVVVLVAVLLASGFRFAAAAQRHDDLRASVGRWLRQNLAPGETFAAEDVGYLGYCSQRRALDMAGVNSPEVVGLAQELRSHAKAFQRIYSELRPEMTVPRLFEIEDNVHFHGGSLVVRDEDREAFLRVYRLEKVFAGDDHPRHWHKAVFRRR